MKKWISLLVLTFFWNSSGLAIDGSTGSGRAGFRAKSESKKTSRWTLEDWLAQKERNQMMDLWLAMYSPSPYEFFVSGTYLSYTTALTPQTEGTSITSMRGALGAYATILGLEGYYENNTTEKRNESGMTLNLRVVGNAVQGTHLTGFYGFRSLRSDESGVMASYNQQFAGADLNLYLNRHFGISGRKQIYFPIEQQNQATLSEDRSEAGLFIDFSAARIFGEWFKETSRVQNSGSTTETTRTGIQTGCKFFF